jgi:hypothetical protein
VTEYGILIVAVGKTGPTLDPPEWVTLYDPDGGDPDVEYPTGALESDVDPAKALRFDSSVEASECWRRQSTRTPLRPDGRPNRPLTSLTVEIKKLPE